MFKRTLAHYTTLVSPRLSPKLNYYVSQLEHRRDQAYDRHALHFGYDTRGMELLKKVLSDGHPHEVCTIPDQVDRYTNGIAPLIEILNRIFDPSIIGVHNFGSFIQSNSVAAGVDYIIPVRPENSLLNYPFGQGWDIWKNMAPLKMLDVDSLELTFKGYMDLLMFSTDKPDYALFSLDTGLLVMQYTVYLNETPPDERLPLEDYLHRFVIYPCLIYDYAPIWLMNVYISILEKSSSLGDDYKQELTTVYGMVGSQFDSFCIEVEKFATNVSSGTLKPETCLSSLPMMNGEVVNGYYHRVLSENGLPIMRQYQWAEFLRDFKQVKLILLVAQLRKELPSYNQLKSYMKRDFNWLYMSHPWTNVFNQKLRIHIETRLDDPVFAQYL